MSQGSDHTHFWHTIWALNIPHKIKTFTWKACRNALPTKVNLCHRGILEEALCEACGLSEEISGHLFWDCKKARETWTIAALPIDIHVVHYREFVDFIWHLIFIQYVGKELLQLVVTITWCMWYTRNKAHHGTTRQSSQEIIFKARSMIESYQLARLAKPHHKEPTDIRWIPLNFPWYKINIDAAVFAVSKSVGIGVVVRDREGSVVAALSKRMPLPLGPLEAKAKAMHEAVTFAKDVGLQDVIFETDSAILSTAQNDISMAPTSIDNVIQDTHHSLQAF